MNPLDLLLEQVASALPADQGDAQRLFHGRGRCYPGLEHVAVDYFHPLLLVTLFEPVEAAWLEQMGEELAALGAAVGVTSVAVQRRFGKPERLQCLRGELPRKLWAREAGLQFGLQLDGRQNLGFFLDMAVARQWLRERAPGRKVLNLFAYTCAFSVVARAAGSPQVVNLDMAAAALRQGQQNHQRNGLATGVQYLGHDLFRSWGKLRRLGLFDLIVVDPPSSQPGSFVAERDYRRVVAKLPELCADGAEILLCLNSPHLDTGFIRALVKEYAPGLEFQERLQNPAAFVDTDPELSLKVMSYRWSASR